MLSQHLALLNCAAFGVVILWFLISYQDEAKKPNLHPKLLLTSRCYACNILCGELHRMSNVKNSAHTYTCLSHLGLKCQMEYREWGV